MNPELKMKIIKDLQKEIQRELDELEAFLISCIDIAYQEGIKAGEKKRNKNGN